MKYEKLTYKDKVYREEKQIDKILLENNLEWLIDSEIENARIKIERSTLIWESGNYYSGFWHYGIFKEGKFHGVFENGIFEGGDFLGKFISGIRLDSNKKQTKKDEKKIRKKL